VELVTLIVRNHARDGAALMIEDLIGYMRRNPEPGHAGDHRAAQIVQRPVAHAGPAVEPCLSFRVALEHPLAIAREDQTLVMLERTKGRRARRARGL
jgi:hypothetical protein